MKSSDEFKNIGPTPDECEAPNYQVQPNPSLLGNLKYLLPGLIFGLVLVKAEIISWYRIQEMFRFQSFHMYGVIGSAIFTGLISVWMIKKFNLKTAQGEEVIFLKRHFQKGNAIGGFIFGLGWALTGACPGPLFAQVGSGYLIIIVTLFSALSGTWIYGLLQKRLPH